MVHAKTVAPKTSVGWANLELDFSVQSQILHLNNPYLLEMFLTISFHLWTQWNTCFDKFVLVDMCIKHWAWGAKTLGSRLNSAINLVNLC